MLKEKHPFVEWNCSHGLMEKIQEKFPDIDFSIHGVRRFEQAGGFFISSEYIPEMNAVVLKNVDLWFPELAKRYSEREINDMGYNLCLKNHVPATESHIVGLLNSAFSDLV